MKIAILDAYTLSHKAEDWNEIRNLGETTVYERTDADQIGERAADADIVLTNKVPFSAATIDRLPNLKFICVLATGYNIIDTVAAKERGIIVANIPAYSTMSVVQMVFAHILNISNRVEHYSQEIRDGQWSACRDFCYWDTPLVEIADKTIGIVGLGNIGMAVARVALAFGMHVLALTSKKQMDLPEGITAVDMPALLAKSDYVSLHCPLTDSTRHIINNDSIGLMKPSAVLINTGRGPLIDEQAVANALNNGRIAAFCADVLAQEPPMADNPLLSARNCQLTPHIAWATSEARRRLFSIALHNVKQFIAGEAVSNCVNK